MGDAEERKIVPALLAKTPLIETPIASKSPSGRKTPTPRTPSNKSGRKTPTLRKRKISDGAETPAKLTKFDLDDDFETPKATPAARNSFRGRLLNVDEEMPVLDAKEQFSHSVPFVEEGKLKM